MAGIGRQATAATVQLFSDPCGVNANLEDLQASDDRASGGPMEIRAQNAAADVADRGETVRYPTVQVYCEKLVNSLTEKFRTFSGTARMTAEIRCSRDGLRDLQEELERCADAVTQVLDGNRGDWGSGMHYAGGYEVAYGAVKKGGRNYIQVAKVTFEIGVSIS